MKLKVVYILLLFVFASSVVVSQSVVVTGKKITYNRKNPVTDYKKTFTINYPKVKARTLALSRKIEAAIDYGTILGLNLKEELTSPQWLEEADFDVTHNKDGILCITLSMNGTAAYPSGISKIVVVNLTTGMRVKAADVFTNISGLTALVRKAQKKEIAKAIAEIKKDPENQEPNPESLFKGAKFTTHNLEWFSVNDKGVTFHYDYGFPHVIQALQPDGSFFFTWNQLRPYMRRGGLLARHSR